MGWGTGGGSELYAALSQFCICGLHCSLKIFPQGQKVPFLSLDLEFYFIKKLRLQSKALS